MFGMEIAGIGIELGRRIVTNEEYSQGQLDRRAALKARGVIIPPESEKEWDTSPPWIESRTGVLSRPMSNPGEMTSDYARWACENAWDDAFGEGCGDMPEFLLLATVTPDHFTTPATNVTVARKMGISHKANCFEEDPENPGPKRLVKRLRNFFSCDITQACSSWGEAFILGYGLTASGVAKLGLIVGADDMQKSVSFNRRTSPSYLLSTGGAAIVSRATSLEKSWVQPKGLFAGVFGGEGGAFEDMIKTRVGGSAIPLRPEHLDPLVEDHLMFMDGKNVYKEIVPMVANEVIPDALTHAGLTLKNIDVLILHQANLRMATAVVKRLSEQYADCVILMADINTVREISLQAQELQKSDKHVIICYNSMDHTGNLTSASIPVGLYEAREHGIIVPGRRVMCVAFGGGFSWCSCIIEWGGAHLFQQK